MGSEMIPIEDPSLADHALRMKFIRVFGLEVVDKMIRSFGIVVAERAPVNVACSLCSVVALSIDLVLEFLPTFTFAIVTSQAYWNCRSLAGQA